MQTRPSLLVRLQDPQDNEAWNTFWLLYEPWIHRWIRRLDPDVEPADAEDVYQEVMSVFIQKIETFQPKGKGSFRCWLRLTIVHQLQKFWRTRKRVAQQTESLLNELSDSKSTLTQQWDDEHDQFIIDKALRLVEGEFSFERMESFRQQFFEGRSAAAVADAFGKSTNAVFKDKSCVLKRLREVLHDLIE